MFSVCITYKLSFVNSNNIICAASILNITKSITWKGGPHLPLESHFSTIQNQSKIRGVLYILVMCRHAILAISGIFVILQDNALLICHSEPPDPPKQFSALARKHRAKNHLDLGLQNSVELLWWSECHGDVVVGFEFLKIRRTTGFISWRESAVKNSNFWIIISWLVFYKIDFPCIPDVK